MPAAFVLEVPGKDGGWIDYGLYRAEWFDRRPDGSYVCAGHGGSPLIFRCVRQEGDQVTSLDGTGTETTYRLRSLTEDRDIRDVRDV